MLAKIGGLLLLAAASGCTASNFASTEKTQRRVVNVKNADGIAEQKPLTKTPYSAGDAVTPSPAETPLVDEMVPEIAVIPVPVGGAADLGNTEQNFS